MIEMVVNFFKGMAIGIANIIPGVSGGTMAFVLGVYDKLTESIGEFFTNKEKRKEYFFFLLTVVLGAGLGILLFAKALKFLLANFNEPTQFFFLGLIAGSIPFILKAKPDMKINPQRILFFVIGFAVVLTFFLVEMFGDQNAAKEAVKTFETTPFLGIFKLSSIDIGYGFWLVLCGFLSAGAMIIPGVSGSFLLMLLGEYYTILNCIDQFIIVPLGVFGVGVLLGIVLFARLIDFLLKKFPSQTMFFILGLVIASLVAIFPGFSLSGITPFLNIGALIVGGGIALLIGKIEVKK